MVSPRLERRLQFVKRVYDLFRPKFYNRITWIVVCGGLGIASTDLIEWLAQIALGLTIGVQVTGDFDALVGMVLVIAALLYNARVLSIEHLGESAARDSQDSGLRSHDIEVFTRTDDLLNEGQLMQILDWIDADHSASNEQTDRLDRFLYAFEGVENSYLSVDVEEAKQRMLVSLNELRVYMSFHFFSYGGRSCLDPDRNVDRGGIHATRDDIAKYDEQAGELAERVGNGKDAYAGYRTAVRDALLL